MRHIASVGAIHRDTLYSLETPAGTRAQAVTDSNGSESAWLPTTSGVPQGSVLGPLLFSIFINDLPDVLVDSKCMLFADDLQVYSSFFPTDLRWALSAFNRNVNAVSAWATANGLSLNKAKTQVMLMGSDAFLKRFDISTTRRVLLEGLPLPYATVVKSLGVYIQPNLDSGAHVKQVVKRVHRVLYSLRHHHKARPRTIRKELNSNLYSKMTLITSKPLEIETTVLADKCCAMLNRLRAHDFRCTMPKTNLQCRPFLLSLHMSKEVQKFSLRSGAGTVVRMGYLRHKYRMLFYSTLLKGLAGPFTFRPPWARYKVLIIALRCNNEQLKSRQSVPKTGPKVTIPRPRRKTGKAIFETQETQYQVSNKFIKKFYIVTSYTASYVSFSIRRQRIESYACAASKAAGSSLSYARAVAPDRDNRIVQARTERVSLSSGKPFSLKKTERIIIGPAEKYIEKYTSSSATKEALIKNVDQVKIGFGVSRLRYGPKNTVIVEGCSLNPDKLQQCQEFHDAGLEIQQELKQLEKLHGRFHQVVKDNNIPTIRELYVVNCIMFHYEHLSYSYKSSCSKTRTKCLPLPSHKKTFYVKNSLYTAIK
ncbi:unnamed protein product [Trichogramma brassicae]|uniref:Reverse transcriptase domain-containing protein n=1 Tax=Trichogramma brassicae TaxID=86971 RepID=A0A6H5IDV1_9HYME|nr:unnamed protein product [Trichogramma brassicae]